MKVYTTATALITGTAVAFAVHAGATQQQAEKHATAWRTEATQWHDVANATLAHDRAVLRQNAKLVKQYKAVVHAANTQAKATVAAAAPVQAAAPAVVVASGGGAPATATS
jgi:hypothetical protein